MVEQVVAGFEVLGDRGGAAWLALTLLESFQAPGCGWTGIVKQTGPRKPRMFVNKARKNSLLSYFREKNEPDLVKATFLRLPK